MKISCYAIIEKEDQIIFTVDEGKLGLKLPGGELEGNELLVDCVKREVQEEIGLNIEVGNLVSIKNYLNKENILRLRFYFKAKYLSGEIKVNQGEVQKIIFVEGTKLADLKEIDFYIPTYYQAIQDYLNNKEIIVHNS